MQKVRFRAEVECRRNEKFLLWSEGIVNCHHFCHTVQSAEIRRGGMAMGVAKVASWNHHHDAPFNIKNIGEAYYRASAVPSMPVRTGLTFHIWDSWRLSAVVPHVPNGVVLRPSQVSFVVHATSVVGMDTPFPCIDLTVSYPCWVVPTAKSKG